MYFAERIRKYEYKFNDTEDMIVEYILKNKSEVVKLPIQALAEKFFTVPNTIVRLSKKMGYDGFSELKNSLKAELLNDHELSYEEESYAHIINIKKTLSLLDYPLLETLVKLIQKSRRVIFYTLGDNINICQVAIKELSMHAPNVFFHTHRHDITYAMNSLTENDLVFLISLSGKKTEILAIAESAKAHHCKVIALTHFCNNPLQVLADFHLYCYAPPLIINSYNVTDKTPILLVLRALTECYWQ